MTNRKYWIVDILDQDTESITQIHDDLNFTALLKNEKDIGVIHKYHEHNKHDTDYTKVDTAMEVNESRKESKIGDNIGGEMVKTGKVQYGRLKRKIPHPLTFSDQGILIFTCVL